MKPRKISLTPASEDPLVDPRYDFVLTVHDSLSTKVQLTHGELVAVRALINYTLLQLNEDQNR